MSERLSDRARGHILDELMKGRFDKARDEMVEKYAAFADRLYKEKYTSVARARMSGLPEGWLPKDDDVNVKFGDTGSEYANLSFNGCEGDIQETGVTRRKFEPVYRRFQTENMNAAFLFERKAPITTAWFKLKEEREDLIAQVHALEREINRVLNSVTTSGALVKRWPEIEPIVRKYAVVEQVKLPAPILTGLNAKLGLAKKAA